MRDIMPKVFVLFLLILAGTASAEVILYQEDFTGSSDQLLDGRAPTISADPNALWQAGDDWLADGTIVWDGVPFGDSAYLPFEPVAGTAYTLMAQISATDGNTPNDWIGMGFTQTANPSGRFLENNNNDDAVYWMLTRAQTADLYDQTFTGVRVAGGQDFSTISENDLMIVLDTMSQPWVVQWYFGQELARTVNVAENHIPYFNYIALTNARCNGTISSLTLTRLATTIPQQPRDVAVFPGETAVLELTADSPNELTYQWFRTNRRTISPHDTHLNGQTEPVLTLENVQQADEAYYYCRVTDQATGRDHYTRVAGVGIKRIRAHWTLDEVDFDGWDFIDLIEGRLVAEAYGNPLFVEGIIGEAVVMEPYGGWGSKGSSFNPSDVTGQLTASFWLDWYGTNGQYQTILAKRNPANWTDSEAMWQISTSQDGPDLWFQSTHTNVSVPQGLHDDGNWQHIVATFDGQNGRVYINGELRAEQPWQFSSNADARLYIGAAETAAEAYHVNGAMDDVRLYNYALDPEEVAEIYYLTTGIKPCVYPIESLYDLTGDCQVSAEDLAMFARQWLVSGKYPDCLPDCE